MNLLYEIYEHLDLISICFALSAATLTLPYGITLALVAGFCKEMSTATPVGTYICMYMSFTLLLYASKDHLSWRILVPWLFCVNALFFALSSQKIILFLTSFPSLDMSAALVQTFYALMINMFFGSIAAIFWHTKVSRRHG